MTSPRSVLRFEELEGRALPQVIPVSAAVGSSVFTDVINQLSNQTGIDVGSISLNSEPSGRGFISSGHGVFFTSPALQADFQQLAADGQALHDAVVNAYLTNPAVQAAQTQLLAFKAEWQATRAADNLVIHAATSDADRQVAITNKAADREEAQAKIAAAKTIVQLALANDPGVKAAMAKLPEINSAIVSTGPGVGPLLNAGVEVVVASHGTPGTGIMFGPYLDDATTGSGSVGPLLIY